MLAWLAPAGEGVPCGCATPGHAVGLWCCLALLLAFALALRGVGVRGRRCVTVCVASVLTVLEGLKIAFQFHNGYTWPEAWVPLSYCSLFLYALWCAGVGRGEIRRTGEAFLAYACPAAGASFLLFPVTSLTEYPLWHFLSLHSLAFHTLMLAVGGLYLRDCPKGPYRDDRARCSAFLTVFAVAALALNRLTDANLMTLSRPFRLPLPALHRIVAGSPVLYTFLILSVYYAIPAGACVIRRRAKNKRHAFFRPEEGRAFFVVEISPEFQ